MTQLKLYFAIGGLVLVILALGLAYTHGVKVGRQDEAQRWAKNVQTEDARNRKLEQSVQDGLNAWAVKFQQERSVQSTRETIYRDRIIKGAQTLPECRIPQSMLDDRNAIRDNERLPND